MVFSIHAAQRPKIGLVLSGGGARGIPELEIIKELDRRGIYPDCIIGTSMGSLIGGLYAVGYTPEEIEIILRDGNIDSRLLNFYSPDPLKLTRAFELPFANVVSFNYDFERFSIGSSNGLFDDQKVNAYLRILLAKKMENLDFDSLPIPFRAIGTNFRTGEKIVFSSGYLFEALRGSMSFPVAFPPLVTVNGTYVIDGGMVDNLPVEEARKLGSDIVIAIDVNEDVSIQGGESANLDNLSGVILHYSVISTQYVAKKEQAKADFLFFPKTNDIGVFSFSKVDEALEIGKAFVRENLDVFDEIEALISPYMPLDKPSRYEDLDYLVIKKVILPENLLKYEKVFEFFKGEVANENIIIKLEELIEEIRNKENLKTVNYYVKNGYYVITCSPLAKTNHSITLGLSGDIGLSFNAVKNRYYNQYYNNVLKISTRNYFERIKLGLDFEYGQDLKLSFLMAFPSAFGDFFNKLSFSFGNIPPYGYRKINNQFKNTNRMVEAEGGLSFTTLLEGRLDLYSQIGYLSLGLDSNFDGTSTRIWNIDENIWALAGLDYHNKAKIVTLKTTYTTEYDFSFKMGYSQYDKLIYSLSYSFSFESAISKKGSILFDVFLGTSKLSRTLYTSFYPNLFNSLVDEKLGIGTEYRYYLFDGRKFYLSSALFCELTSPHYDGGAVPGINNLIPFSSLSVFDLALEVGFGFIVNELNLLLKTRIGLSGNMVLAFEIK